MQVHSRNFKSRIIYTIFIAHFYLTRHTLIESLLIQKRQFSSAFAKLRKATISFVTSRSLSARLQVRSHVTIQLTLDGFCEI
jgi:hypothetical protein